MAKRFVVFKLFLMVMFLLYLLLVSACSFKPPMIVSFSVKRLQVENEQGTLRERLSVFLLYSDEDGKNDYNTVTVTHKETGLTWVLDRANSSFFSSVSNSISDKNKVYAGSNKMVHPLGKFSSGTYTFIADDLSGNRAVKTFELTEKKFDTMLPFTFTITETDLKIEITENKEKFNFFLVLSGADKQPLVVKNLGYISASLTDSVVQLKEAYGDARYIQCMAEIEDGSCAYLTKSYTLY